MIHVIIHADTEDAVLFQFNCDTTHEVVELAEEFLTDQGLMDASEDSDFPLVYQAFAVNTEHQEHVMPDAEPANSTTFIEWLTTTDKAVVLTNVYNVYSTELE
jgi:hypothetical protein